MGYAKLILQMAWLYAQIVFVYFTLIHFLKFPFRRRKHGEAVFLRYYRPDRLLPLSRVDKDWILKFSRCLNCGYCDTACPALMEVPREKFPGPSYLATTLSRSSPDFWAVDLDFSLCEKCHQCEKACPNGVPVKEALEFIEAKTSLPMNEGGI